MYRVIVGTFSDRGAAADARDAFKAKYPNRKKTSKAHGYCTVSSNKNPTYQIKKLRKNILPELFLFGLI